MTTKCFSPARRHIVQAMVLGASGVLAPLAVKAQAAPARILIGFPAGGSIDALGRALADRLKDELGRPVVVENRPGAGGRLVVDVLKSMPRDGSVVLLSPDVLTSFYPFIYKKLNYDPVKDLVPVGQVSEFAMALAVNADLGIKNLKDFIGWARKDPSRVNYGIPAPGSPLHFFGLMLSDGIGVKMNMVPYQGSAPMMTNLIGGQIPCALDVVGSLLEQHRAGKIRMIAVSTPQRTLLAPNVPTFAEQGFPSIVRTGFNGLYAAPGVPAAALTAWNQALAKVLTQADLRQRMAGVGFIAAPASAAAFAQRATEDARRWEPIIRASGFTAE